MKNGILIVQALLTCSILVALLVVTWKSRRQKKQQDLLVADLKGQHFWRVNLATEGFMGKLLRLSPFEAKGILIDEGESFRIKGFWQKNGHPVESTWLKSAVKVEWIGNTKLRAGNLHWARLATAKGQLYFCADTGINALNSREALSDIFRSAFPDIKLTEHHTKDFALEKNARSLLAVGLFFALLFFALIDTFVWSNFELADAQIGILLTHPIALTALLIGLPLLLFSAYQWLLGGKVPARESWALASMLTVAILSAATPALKRVDQALDTEGTLNRDYLVTGMGTLEPIDKTQDLPSLRFRRANEYWSQFKSGDKYPIPMLRGPMGLWQIDHAQFDMPVQDFYKKHNK